MNLVSQFFSRDATAAMSVRMNTGSSIGAFVRRGNIRGSRGKRKSQRRGEVAKVMEVVKVMEETKVMEMVKVIEVSKVMERGRKAKKSWRGAGARWKHWRFLKSTKSHTDGLGAEYVQMYSSNIGLQLYSE